MWIPTEHEKYGVGKLDACIHLDFSSSLMLGMCEGFLEVLRGLRTEISQSLARGGGG